MDSTSRPWYSGGLRFLCTRCSRCCRHDSGYVFLSNKDIAKLAHKFSLTRKAFIDSYCKKVDFSVATRISLKEQENFDCIFWKDGGCTVYDARPLQCRAYPFWSHNLDRPESWADVAKECPGVNIGELHSQESIETWLAAREAEPYAEKG